MGFAIAAGAWVLHVAALSLAPISTVETMISGGLVALAFLGQRLFGLRVTRREWLGLCLCAVGLGLLGATATAGGDHASYSNLAMTAFQTAAVAFGATLLLRGSLGDRSERDALLLAAGAGILLGVANVSIKALTGTVPHDPMAIIGPWSALALGGGAVAFLTLARGLQVGEAIPVAAVTTVAANCAAILGGVLVFGDSIGEDPLTIASRSVAFATVLASVALMPSPVHAARAPAAASA